MNADLKRLRTFWRWLIDNKQDYYNIFAEFVNLEKVFRLDDIIDATKIMLERGFLSIKQLTCANGMDWGTKKPHIKRLLDDLVMHMQFHVVMLERSRTMLAEINRLLDVSKTTALLISRFNDCGPAAAVRKARINEWDAAARDQRFASDRFGVVVDSIKSKSSYVSAIRGYLTFFLDLKINEVPLPPRLEWIVTWSTFFRNHKTFSSYCSALRWATEAVGGKTEVFEDKVLKRAKGALKRVSVFREKRWVQYDILQKIVGCAIQRGERMMAMAYLAAYIFLSRVPSELLVLEYGGDVLTSRQDCMGLNVIQCAVTEVRVHLNRRKNAAEGASLRRMCTCKTHSLVCPIHALSPWIKSHKVGDRLFPGLTPAAFNKRLRMHLDLCEIAESKLYSSHAFRRGAAQDLSLGGCSLRVLLVAGGWHSRACFLYLKHEDLNMASVAAFLANESDSDGD